MLLDLLAKLDLLVCVCVCYMHGVLLVGTYGAFLHTVCVLDLMHVHAQREVACTPTSAVTAAMCVCVRAAHTSTGSVCVCVQHSAEQSGGSNAITSLVSVQN